MLVSGKSEDLSEPTKTRWNLIVETTEYMPHASFALKCIRRCRWNKPNNTTYVSFSQKKNAHTEISVSFRAECTTRSYKLFVQAFTWEKLWINNLGEMNNHLFRFHDHVWYRHLPPAEVTRFFFFRLFCFFIIIFQLKILKIQKNYQ